MKIYYLLVVLGLFACQSSKKENMNRNSDSVNQEGKFKEVILFDGKTLEGWKNYGGGKFYVEDGAIVGEAASGLPNSFLATEEIYENFELELDMLIDTLLNSGIQIRSNTYEQETKTIRWGGVFNPDGTKDVKERTWEAGRFWGYQVEVDPRPDGWSAAIYEEGGRGFLHSPSETQEASGAFKLDDWNHFRIKAIGDHLQTWLNGVPVADIHDNLTKTGYIALQLHGIGKHKEKIGQKVRWKNIKLTVK